MNAVLLAALIAVGRAALLPRLMAARVGAAALLALLLVPRVGAVGAALGFLLAETLLLLLAVRACRRAGFPLPQMRPLGVAAIATVPMALAVQGVADSLPLALGIGALTYAATLAAGSRLRPRLLRDVLGDLRYP
jgi:O-antigen/teichoic acid export membrane protein